MNFYLGCAVWSYKDWVGNLYPPKSQPREFLNLYSQRFTTVEGNTTFYAIPSAETIKKWVEQTPPGFKFCPKLHRQITHQGLLTPHIPKAIAFLREYQVWAIAWGQLLFSYLLAIVLSIYLT